MSPRRTGTHGLAGAAVVLACSLVAGCKKSVPDRPPPSDGGIPQVEVLKDGRWLFTYVETDGRFQTTDKPEIVPEVSRRLVRVLDPARPFAERVDTTSVYVVDVGELLRAGKVAARALAREAFETAALLQLPPGESSLRSSRPPAPIAAPEIPDGAAAPPAGSVAVTLYGTSWCGACRQARQYLQAKKVPFADKDIERDPAAAQELAQKAARLGVPADRVPILDIRGRLMVGFDRARVDALLGQAI